MDAVGALLLLFSTNVLDDNAWDYVWPVVIIAVGAVIMACWSGRTISRGASPDDGLRSAAVFGGSKLVSAARQFEGAWLTAIFGGITLDLRDAELAPDVVGLLLDAAEDRRAPDADPPTRGTRMWTPPKVTVAMMEAPCASSVASTSSTRSDPPAPVCDQ